jgi:hypothetical protein
MRKDWNGLLKVLNIEHLAADGTVLWSDNNLYNILHLTGEQFVLSAVFSGGVTNTVIPANYYFGLDNRTTIAAGDSILSLSSEPTANGYGRIAVASNSVFIVSLQSSHYRADGPIISFSAAGGGWGPVKNLFLATSSDNTGVLIASVALSQSVTLADGEAVNVRMGLSLRDCP